MGEKHPPQNDLQGHAQSGGGATADTMVMVSQLIDDEEVGEKDNKKEKRKCPKPGCGHRSSKDVCKKCGTSMSIGSVASNVSDGGDCHSLVRTWMTDHRNENETSELIAGFA